jgi:hypothetical protein
MAIVYKTLFYVKHYRIWPETHFKLIEVLYLSLQMPVLTSNTGDVQFHGYLQPLDWTIGLPAILGQ